MRNTCRALCLTSLIAVLSFEGTAVAQFAYSAFTEGTVAYAALVGSEINFARGNPAALAWSYTNARTAYIMENNENNLDAPPHGFGLQFAVTPRLRIAVGRWDRSATTGVTANRFFTNEPLRLLGFGYRQDWSAGMGIRVSRDLALGISARKEIYSASPYARELYVEEEYWTADFGVSFSEGAFKGGIIFRNFYRDHGFDPSAFQVTRRLADGTMFTWNPTDFAGVAFEPEPVVEAGIHWAPSSRLELLGDASSRDEFAVGLRSLVIWNFFITGGFGERYDRIYTDSAVRYGALGGQFYYNRFAVAIAWIIPIHAMKNRFISTPCGIFEQRQVTFHRILGGIAVAF